MRTRTSDRVITRSSVSKKGKREKKAFVEVRSTRKSVTKGVAQNMANRSRSSSRGPDAALPSATVIRRSISRSANRIEADRSTVNASRELKTRKSITKSSTQTEAKRKSARVSMLRSKTNDSIEHVDVSPRDSRRMASKRVRNSSRNSFKPSKSKRKKVAEEVIEVAYDPYELSDDGNGASPLHSVVDKTTSSSASFINTLSKVDRKRKFFTTRAEGTTHRPVFGTVGMMQHKLNIKTKRLSKSAASRLRPQPMTVDERARIAATTIWLPIPSQKHPNQELPSHFESPQPPTAPPPRQTPKTDSLPPIEENDDFLSCGGDGNILTGNPSIQVSGFTNPASSNVSKLSAGPCSTPLNKLLGKVNISNTGGGGSEGERVEPFSDVSNILVSLSSPPAPSASETKNARNVRRISFAQPLSPILKRNSGSQGSSGHSASGLKVRQKNRCQDEDASNYEEWLKEFNSQLQPYEDFELTIE